MTEKISSLLNIDLSVSLGSWIENFATLAPLAIVLSFFSLLVSGSSFIFSKVNARRQIRIGKLEEILEGLLFIRENYSKLKSIYEIERKIKSPEVLRTGLETMTWQIEKKSMISEFLKVNDSDKFKAKVTRLAVLSNSYLPNEKDGIKYMILSILNLSENLLQSTVFDNYDIVLKSYKTFPEPLIFSYYIGRIEKILIKEMGLGYNSLEMEKLVAYKSRFKSDLLLD